MELPTKLSSTETITSLGYTYTISRKVQLASKHLRNPWPPRKDSPSTLSIPETPSMPNRSRPPVSRGNVTRYRSTHQAFCTVTRVFARMTMTFAAMTAEGKPVVPGVPRIGIELAGGVATNRRRSSEWLPEAAETSLKPVHGSEWRWRRHRPRRWEDESRWARGSSVLGKGSKRVSFEERRRISRRRRTRFVVA